MRTMCLEFNRKTTESANYKSQDLPRGFDEENEDEEATPFMAKRTIKPSSGSGKQPHSTRKEELPRKKEKPRARESVSMLPICLPF